MALDLVDIHDNQSILEVAVGTGWMFSEIVQRNPNGKNIGIDISEGMLLRAKRRLLKQKNDNYSLSIGSAFKLKVEDATIDVLVNNYMFDLIPFSQMNRIMDEFNRVLKKNGQLLIINMTKGDGFGASLYESLYRFSPRLMGGCRGVNLSNLLIQHGFRIETREYVQQMLFPSEIILAYK
jgi:ubiquinone/menaquinone biosynthesis C-methylase UbiE